MNARRVLFWLLTMAWAVEMFHLSTAAYSAEVSRSLLDRLLRALHAPISSAMISALNSAIRSIAHLTEYGIFTVLLYGALSADIPLLWRQSLALQSLALAAIYSITDEVHQRFVPGRGPSALDCAIDVAGAGFALLVLRNCFRSARWKS